MRISTPRATPVAAVPPSGRAPAERGVALAGPILIVWPGGQHPLVDGSVLIGRSHECELRLDDALVSRIHARIRVEAERATIEDLHSTNGIYLGGDRIAHAGPLHDGDVAQIGTQLLSFFAYTEELAPDSGVSGHDRLRPDPPMSFPAAPLGAPGTSPMPTTTRAPALTMVGNLARRFAREGRVEEGAALLIPHLKRILRGANAGLEVPEPLCEQAATYAMDVAVWTADAKWLDYIVELHVAAKSLMTHPAILALQRAERWLGAIDRRLLAYYVEACGARPAPLTDDEQLRLRLLERLLSATL